MKKMIVKCVMITVLLVAGAGILTAHAQQPIPIGPGGSQQNSTPIGGIAVVAVLGGGYAVKKLYDRNKE